MPALTVPQGHARTQPTRSNGVQSVAWAWAQLQALLRQTSCPCKQQQSPASALSCLTRQHSHTLDPDLDIKRQEP